jgi:hypothetical protein
MYRRTIVLFFMLCMSQIALAEESAIPHSPKSQKREFQLNDIIAVQVNYHSSRDSDNSKRAEKDSSDATPSLRLKNDDLSFTVAASVVDLRRNGDLVIEGRKSVVKDGAVWEQSLSGVVRPDRIGPERTIRSDDVAECRIRIRKKGAVQEALSGPPLPHPLSVDTSSDPSRNPAELQKKLHQLAALQSEIRQLRAETGSGQEIIVRVKMLQVSLTKMSKMGIDLTDLNSSATIKDADDFMKAATKLGLGRYSAAKRKDESKSFFDFVDWLEKNNVAKSLAEPTMITMEGRPASFHVGGEIPVPTGAPNAIEFKKFGTEMDILPIALGRDRVRLELRARVSDVLGDKSIEVNGQHVPAMDVRQCDTAIETQFGHTSMLLGLVETRIETEKHENKVEELTDQVALMLIVTPELVEPPSKIKQTSHMKAGSKTDL